MKYNFDAVPENLKKFIDPSLDRDTRLMAAQGLVPIPPEDMALVLFYLTSDDDQQIVKESEKSLFSIPDNAIARVLSNSSSPPELLDYFARKSENDNHIEKIILNNATSDSTIQHLAQTSHNQTLIELISDNHQRILRSDEIVDALSKNPAISRSTLDKVISFISLYLEKHVKIPDFLKDQPHEDSEIQEQLQDAEMKVAEVEVSFLDDIEIPEEFIEEKEVDGQLELEEDEQSTIYQNIIFAIKKMSLPEKLKLCLIGNAEARRALVKEPNRIIALAALRNPRITDMEISLAAQSTSVSEDILREIGNNRDWTRHYDVKVSLVNNPKSPPDISMNFIRHMRDRDLKVISKSKNVPGVVSAAAKRIVQQKQESQSLKL
jgi:hypothetical protein